MTTLQFQNTVLDEVCPAGEAWMCEVKKGQLFRIVDLEGNQAVDTLFISAENSLALMLRRWVAWMRSSLRQASARTMTWSARWCATSSPRSASSWTKRRTPPVPRNRASSPPRIPRSPSASFRPTRSWQSPASPRPSQKQARTLTATSSPSERGDPAVK